MLRSPTIFFFFFFNDTATTEIYTLSLHDALPISFARQKYLQSRHPRRIAPAHDEHAHPGLPHAGQSRSEEHTSELQSPCNLVCRLLLEKKKKKTNGGQISFRTLSYTSMPHPRTTA